MDFPEYWKIQKVLSSLQVHASAFLCVILFHNELPCMTHLFALCWRVSLLLFALSLGHLGADDTDPAATLDIHAPGLSAGFWGRYVILNKLNRISGWITSATDAATYRIAGLPARPDTHFRAILYVPGCALQTLDIAITERKNYQYSFFCALLPPIQLNGTVTHMGTDQEGVTLEAKYVASWAASFFQFADGTDTEIPLGNKTSLDSQNEFALPIPDFSKDKLASSSSHFGEIRIFVRDRATGLIVDQLRWASGIPSIQPTKFGGIPITALSGDSLNFKFCETGTWLSHDHYGFALRNNALETCPAQ
jgi:hypothetical protein